MRCLHCFVNTALWLCDVEEGSDAMWPIWQGKGPFQSASVGIPVLTYDCMFMMQLFVSDA